MRILCQCVSRRCAVISIHSDLCPQNVITMFRLEFSISKLKEVWRVAVLAGSAMMLAAIVAGLAVGALLERSFSESLFTSVLVALSSTTVVVNGMSASDQDSTFGRGLVGILLMQDVYVAPVSFFYRPKMCESESSWDASPLSMNTCPPSIFLLFPTDNGNGSVAYMQIPWRNRRHHFVGGRDGRHDFCGRDNARVAAARVAGGCSYLCDVSVEVRAPSVDFGD